MTIDNLFNIAAPIAIMHFAEVSYEPLAKKAVRKLKRNEDDPMVKRYFDRYFILPKSPNYWEAYIKHPNPGGGLSHIADIYAELFKEIVERERPAWEPFYDQWGARGYNDSYGKKVFSGSDCSYFPWFVTAKALVERINEHT